MKKITNLFKVAVVTCAVTIGSMVMAPKVDAQIVFAYSGPIQYLSDNLLATNTIIVGGTAAAVSSWTNLVSGNYNSGGNPNIITPGNGIFTVNPASPYITFSMFYEMYSNTGALFTGVSTNVAGGQATNMIAWFQPLLDDDALKFVPGANTITNALLVGVNMPLIIPATNLTGYCQSQGQIATTNFVGCKYGKLVAFSGLFTNAIVIYKFKNGEWVPSK